MGVLRRRMKIRTDKDLRRWVKEAQSGALREFLDQLTEELSSSESSSGPRKSNSSGVSGLEQQHDRQSYEQLLARFQELSESSLERSLKSSSADRDDAAYGYRNSVGEMNHSLNPPPQEE